MKDGIYTVVFKSNLQSVGEGIVVVNRGMIHGADIAFTIRGKITHPVMELDVHYYNQDIPSVLGMKEDYSLEMHCREREEGHYHFYGHMKGEPSLKLDAYAVYINSILK
ncbi:nucleoside transporter [Salmonella enterica]|nr:nucleoside transporter [Salmonella enterica]EHV2308766.1 nucleoside transporter [Salmonella enterica]EHV3174983.1 nucleoside transporter [Salmonella enterica]